MNRVMEIFKKNRLLFWLLLFLTVLNVSALISYFIFRNKNSESLCEREHQGKCNYFQQELNLSESQVKKVEDINTAYSMTSEPLVADIREIRSSILNELEKTDPDTALISEYSRNLTLLQLKMQKANINQFLALKKVCNTIQLQRLSALYRDLYGCPVKEKGKQHRYRHGQGKNQR
jgi:hypothetical protein